MRSGGGVAGQGMWPAGTVVLDAPAHGWHVESSASTETTCASAYGGPTKIVSAFQ